MFTIATLAREQFMLGLPRSQTVTNTCDKRSRTCRRFRQVSNFEQSPCFLETYYSTEKVPLGRSWVSVGREGHLDSHGYRLLPITVGYGVELNRRRNVYPVGPGSIRSSSHASLGL